MNFDLIVNRLKKTSPEDYQEYLLAINPSLIHFLGFFSNSPEQTQEWFIELIENFYRNIKNRNQIPGNCKLLIFRGAIKLIRKKNSNIEILEKCNAQIYEEALLQPLPSRLFEINYIPNQEELERFRSQHLSTAMRLLMDLLFQEGFSITEIAQILNLSENVLEPFLFTAIQRLMNEPVINPPDHEDELTFFTRLLQGNARDLGLGDFPQRLRSLRAFLGLDIRERLTHSEIVEICKLQFPHFNPNANSENPKSNLNVDSSGSLIDQIKQRNQEMKLDEAAREINHPEFLSNQNAEFQTSPKIVNENIFLYARYALMILTLFLFSAVYRTLNPDIEKTVSSPELSKKAVSLVEFQNSMSRSLGTLIKMDGEFPIHQYEWIKTDQQSASISLINGTVIEIDAGSIIQVQSENSIALRLGSLKIQTKKQRIAVLSNNGEVLISSIGEQHCIAHIAKFHRDHTIIGNLKGTIVATPINQERLIDVPEGQQIILGTDEAQNMPFDETFYLNSKPITQINRRKLNLNTAQSYSNFLTREELSEILLSSEKIKEKPSVVQQDYLQKL